MRKLLVITIIILGGLAMSANSQVTLTREEAATALANAKLVPILREENAALRVENKELREDIKAVKNSQRTPCTLSIEASKNDLVFWLKALEDAQGKRTLEKQIVKTLKVRRKQTKKAMSKACGYKPGKKLFATLWDNALKVAPLATIILLR